MLAGYSFRPRLWALALAAAACAAGIALGNWQLRRAEEKRVVLPRVAVEGEFLPRHTIYLDNKTRRGQAGYEIVTPLKLRGSSSHVLVNRGWIDAGKTREVLPEVRTPPGELRIEGIALDRLPRPMQLKQEKSRVRQSVDIAAYAAETGLQLEPRVIEQHSDSGDGLARDWAPHDAGAEKNQAYALQWYSLAALAVVLVLVLSFRKIEAASK
ncbi:MAG TPA: SURF1 family protein [Burkholderiales bacterium]|nr:SURF1 family protein [Burkholderiales bacterium]